VALPGTPHRQLVIPVLDTADGLRVDAIVEEENREPVGLCGVFDGA
jgi:hypothetical protein